MDSLSQMVLGAGVAEAVLGRKAGNRAILWGAIAGTIPDLDVIPAQWMDTVSELAFHRGITHSLLFSLALAPILAWLVNSIYKNRFGSFKEWTILFFLSLFTHPILDCFTTWGTQLFWPLEHRIAWKTIFVIDPFYTLPFLICLLWLMFKSRESEIRRKLIIIALTISTAYLGFTVINKVQVNNIFEQALNDQNIEYIRYDSRPTPLQNILWTVNVEAKDAYYIGFYSFFDDDKDVEFHRHEKNQDLPFEVETHPKVKKLKSITEGWYNLEVLGVDSWVLNDYRFGQTGSYQNGEGDFVFSYEIQRSQDDELSITKRETTSAEAGKEMLYSLWERIKGEKHKNPLP